MTASTPVYRSGRFEIRPAERAISAAGHAVALGARAFDTLLALLERRERVVTTQELLDLVWPGLVVEENNLRQQVAALRKILGPQAVVTIPGRGYQCGLALDQPAGGGHVDAAAAVIAAPAANAHPLPRDTTDALPESRTHSGTRHSTVAVLAFENLSGDPAQEYFSDGITQDIATRLSKFRWLTVLGRGATHVYKGRTIDVRRIADELHASYVVAGSVRRGGDRVRVSAELIDGGSADSKWSGQYDRELKDIFAVQDAITENIVAQLEPQIGLAERQRVAHTQVADLQVWDCFHLGVAHFYKFTAADNLEAQRLFQKSRDMDSGFGDAHAWWAYATLLGMVYWDTEPARGLLDSALAAADRALALDGQNALFYMLKARVQLARGEYDSALIGNEIALSMNPTLAAAYCGLADTLTYLGRGDEALGRFEKALALSPHDPQRWAFLTYGALALIFKRDFEAALAWANQADEMPNRQYWTLAHKAVALAYLGRKEEARDCTARLLAENRDFSCAYARRKLFYLKLAPQLEMYLEGLALAGVPQT